MFKHINVIHFIMQGVYPIRPTIPGAIGGNEGVGEVVASGSMSSSSNHGYQGTSQ